MSTKYYYFSGPCKWAKVRDPDDYMGDKRWTIDTYLGKADLKELREAGLQLKQRKDDDGTYVKFTRPVSKQIKGEDVEFSPPDVWLPKEDGTMEAYEEPIGNGSEVTVKISVFDTQKGKGHRMEAIRIDKLVEYEKPEGVF